MPGDTGIQLEFSDGRAALTALPEINLTLAAVGAHVEPLGLSGTSPEMGELLAQPTMSQADIEKVIAHFVLPREQLLEVITAAGRPPNVPGGGELNPLDALHNTRDPNLWVVQPGADFSRFDRYHVNAADDGTGVDEVAQLLHGGEILIQKRLPDANVLSLHLTCPDDSHGWIVAHNAGEPHIGSLSRAGQGTKFLVQVIGPPQWKLRYVD